MADLEEDVIRDLQLRDYGITGLLELRDLELRDYGITRITGSRPFVW